MLGWLRRYRHGKGFGIHSPFAYRLIMEVLEEKLPYYDYTHLNTAQDRLIYRIAVRFQPRKIRGFSGANIIAAQLACPNATITDAQDWQLAIVTPYTKPEDVLRGKDGECTVIIIGEHRKFMDESRRILNEIGYGMTFDNAKDTAIAVLNKKLPRQDFKVKF